MRSVSVLLLYRLSYYTTCPTVTRTYVLKSKDALLVLETRYSSILIFLG